jgi:hypothetical protein
VLSHKELLIQPPFTFQVLFSVRGERGAVNSQAINCELIGKAQEKWRSFSPCAQKEQKGVLESECCCPNWKYLWEGYYSGAAMWTGMGWVSLQLHISAMKRQSTMGMKPNPTFLQSLIRSSREAKHRLPARSVPWLPHVGGLCSLFLSPPPPWKTIENQNIPNTFPNYVTGLMGYADSSSTEACCITILLPTWSNKILLCVCNPLNSLVLVFCFFLVHGQCIN